jgi:hypothetical protein
MQASRWRACTTTYSRDPNAGPEKPLMTPRATKTQPEWSDRPRACEVPPTSAVIDRPPILRAVSLLDALAIERAVDAGGRRNRSAQSLSPTAIPRLAAGNG